MNFKDLIIIATVALLTIALSYNSKLEELVYIEFKAFALPTGEIVLVPLGASPPTTSGIFLKPKIEIASPFAKEFIAEYFRRLPPFVKPGILVDPPKLGNKLG